MDEKDNKNILDLVEGITEDELDKFIKNYDRIRENDFMMADMSKCSAGKSFNPNVILRQIEIEKALGRWTEGDNYIIYDPFKPTDEELAKMLEYYSKLDKSKSDKK